MLKSIQQMMILALSLVFPVFASGAILNEDDAKNVAAEFFQSGEIHRLADRNALTLVHVATDATSNPVCYVFNAKDGHGFVIVSADENAMPVIAYSTVSTWSSNSVPDAAGRILSAPVFGLNNASDRLSSARAGELENKVLETPTWSQEAPFNGNIPNRRLAGCVGVALAEIMKYHAFPATRPASLVNSGETTVYAWENMRNDNYRSGYSQDEADGVATLVADAAIAIGTDFGMSSSSAFEVKVPYALASMFGYDPGVSYKKRAEMDKASWDALIVNEINEGRPVLYSGQDVSSGHAFVCDGYEKRGGVVFFHINWGWGGSANGYYASDALNPVVSRSHSYNDLTTIVYNIKPSSTTAEWSPVHITSDERQVGITLNVADVLSGETFSVRAGALKNISNSDFSGKLTVALFGANGIQKCLLNDGRSLKLISMQVQKYVDFSCQLPAGITVADGDVVRLVTKAGDDAPWLPVAGDLLAPGEVPAKGGEIPYFSVAIPASTDAAEVSADDNKVIKGRDFSFKVTPKSTDKVITVKANGFILMPDANNVYKIINVLEDQNIDILVQNASEVLSKSTLWVEAGKLQELLNENETATVVDLTLFGTMNVNDFVFIRDRMKLNRLDISQVNILASGSNPANAIPAKAFSGYRSLQTIILPSNLTTFKSGCFNNTGLKSIEIPASVGTYEYNIFVGCSSLREVIVRRSSPAWLNWCVFEGTPKARLVVPVGASAAYKAKENWQDFKEIEEQNAVAPDTYKVSVKEEKDLKFTALTEGTEFAPGSEYKFTLESNDTFGDACMEVYANSTRLYVDADGTYSTRITSNTLIHVIFRQPEATTVDKTWKITGEAGGVGLVTEVVNVPVGQSFTVRANAIKVPKGDEAAKFYCMVLTDKDGGIKEFISPIVANTQVTTGNLTYNFTCQVNEASVREGNQLRLATSYNKKNWSLVAAEADSLVDRISAVGNKVIYHTITMPQSVTGAVITGAATQVVRGMPFTLRVTPVVYTQRILLTVNGTDVSKPVAIANYTNDAVKEDLDIQIQVLEDAWADTYYTVTVQEGELAGKLAGCETFPERLKVSGTMTVSDFDVFRNHAGALVDLDLADVTIKGTAITRNSIPANAFVPTQSTVVSALSNIIMPNNLERINENAFARCIQIKEFTVPASVTFVGSGAFSSCVNLTKITMQGSTPPATGNMTPFPSNTAAITLEVPKGSETAYAAASFWNTLGPKAAKSYYRIQLNSERSCPYTSKYDFEKIEVTNTALQVAVGLPNCPSFSKVGNIMRKGVLFKLYDNGKDVFTISNTSIKVQFAPDQYGYGGQYTVWFDPSVGSNSYKFPTNHVLDVVFYYPITFQNLDGADNVKAEIVNLTGDDKYDFDLNLYTYGASGKKTAYKEGKDYKFRLTPPSPKTALTVKVENKIMTKSGENPQYQWQNFDVYPDDEGLYTIPALPGDTWVKITGYTRVEEGEPVDAEDLSGIRKDDVDGFTDLAITGTMDDAAFEAVREKFESVENLDLSGIDNESIPDNAFEGMETLHNVILSENVSDIGASSFKDCENLESVIIPGVTSIGEGAFDGCSNLTSIILPSSSGNGGNVFRAARAGGGINAESFRGLNPNCLIYMGDTDIPDADHLNIILNVDGHRIAASDIILDGNHPFNAPASFSLGSHRISLSVDIPGSNGYDVDGGWKGLMLPFSPTGFDYGIEFDKRNGTGLSLFSFDDPTSETMTVQSSIVANRPYMASVCAPFEAVPVTFYADGQSDGDNFVYDVVFTPIPEETVAVGKEFSLYGSFDGDSRLGECFTLDETGSRFMLSASEDSVVIRPFDAYLCANDGVTKTEFAVGDHPLWVHNPEFVGESRTNLYRTIRIQLASATVGASVYYTVDGTDPTVADGTRKLYEDPFAMEGDAMTVRAVAEYKGNVSDNVTLDFELKKAALDYTLLHNWNWISHNLESDIDVSGFATAGISRIVSQTQEVVRDPKAGLVGSLKQLSPAVAYKVCVSDESWSASVGGVAFDPTAVVSLRRGWNWIGCPVDDASLLITDLFANLKAEEGDMIVGLDGYGQADADGVWKGSLTTLAPGVGYMYYSNSDKEFTYSLVPATEEPVPAAAPVMTAGSWVVDNHRYPSVMPVTACLVEADDSVAGAGDYAVAAFCGDECRGVGVHVDGAVMINVHGNIGDLITFRYIAPDSREMLSPTVLGFDEMPVSTFGNPYRISLGGTTAVKAVTADAFEVVGKNGGITLKGDLSAVTAVEVYDLAGAKIASVAKANDSVLTVANIGQGVHIILVRTDNTCIYRKVTVR